MLGRSLPRGIRPRDVAVHERSAEAVLVAAATRLSARIQAGYDRALHVDDLRLPIDTQTAVRIVPDRIEGRGVEGRGLDPVHGYVRSTREFRIAALVHVRVPFGNRLRKVLQR